MKKFIKENKHHFIALLILIAVCIYTAFSVYGSDLLKDERDVNKDIYNECLVYEQTGTFGNVLVTEENKKSLDEMCKPYVEKYKENGIYDTNSTFEVLVSNSGFLSGEYFLAFVFLLVASLMFCDLAKNKKKKTSLKDLYKQSLKSIWIVPVLMVLLYITAFIIRGPFNPIFGEIPFTRVLSFALYISVLMIIYSLTFINFGLFTLKKCKSKIGAYILDIFLFVIYMVISFVVMGYLSLMFETEDLNLLTMLGYINVDFESNDCLPLIGALINFGVTFVFTYLTYNEKLNKKLIKKH